MQVKKEQLKSGMEQWTGSKLGKESPCLYNIYAEYIMRNASLDEAEAGIKIAWRNVNNLRYADETSLIAENEEKLKSLLMKVNYSMFKVRRGGREKIPLIQGKEQRLRLLEQL